MRKKKGNKKIQIQKQERFTITVKTKICFKIYK